MELQWLGLLWIAGALAIMIVAMIGEAIQLRSLSRYCLLTLFEVAILMIIWPVSAITMICQILHYTTGPLRRAVEARQALALNPTHSSGFRRRGVALREAGRLDEAVSDFSSAIELEPEAAWLYVERAYTFAVQAGFADKVLCPGAALTADEVVRQLRVVAQNALLSENFGDIMAGKITLAGKAPEDDVVWRFWADMQTVRELRPHGFFPGGCP